MLKETSIRHIETFFDMGDINITCYRPIVQNLSKKDYLRILLMNSSLDIKI